MSISDPAFSVSESFSSMCKLFYLSSNYKLALKWCSLYSIIICSLLFHRFCVHGNGRVFGIPPYTCSFRFAALLTHAWGEQVLRCSDAQYRYRDSCGGVCWSVFPFCCWCKCCIFHFLWHHKPCESMSDIWIPYVTVLINISLLFCFRFVLHRFCGSFCF